MADYQGVLADLRVKLAALDKERSALETAIAAIEGLAPTRMEALFSPRVFADPKAFEGLTMRQAVTKQLSEHGQQPQTTAQIAKALKDGGMHAKAKSFRAQVYNTLHNMSQGDGPVQKDADSRWRMR